MYKNTLQRLFQIQIGSPKLIGPYSKLLPISSLLVKLLWMPMYGLIGCGDAKAEAIVSSEAFIIQGDNLSSASDVQIDGKSILFQVKNDHEILIDPLPLSSKPITITVITPGGSVVLNYVGQQEDKVKTELKISAVSPAMGSSDGGWSAFIQGEGFMGKRMDVFFGGKLAGSVDVNSDTVMTITVPPHEPGVVDVVIMVAGIPEAKLQQAITYTAPPSLLSVSPMSGPVTGGTKLTILGSGFSTTVQPRVILGRVDAKSVKVKDSQTLEVETASYINGAVDVIIINPDGQRGQLPKGFTYLPVPVIRSFGPVS